MPASAQRRKQKWRSKARRSPAVVAAAKLLGARIRELRQERKLTQEEAAHRARLDYKHLQLIEQGGTNVTLASLVGLAKALDVPLAALFATQKQQPADGEET